MGNKKYLINTDTLSAVCSFKSQVLLQM